MSDSKMKMITRYVFFHKNKKGKWEEVASSHNGEMLEDKNIHVRTGFSYVLDNKEECLLKVKQICNDWASQNYRVKKRTFIIIDGEI